jgi:amino acid transporter
MGAMQVENSCKDVHSATLLEKEGYKQELERNLSVVETVGMVLSAITPTASVFALVAIVFPIAGMGTFYSFLLAGIIAVCVGANMAELGSAYPISGGLYNIVARVLGKPMGYLAMIDYVMQAIFIPASMALGVSVYMQMFFPGINPNIWATGIMLTVTFLAILSVKDNARITTIFLVLELLVIAVIVFLGFANPVNSLSSIMLHPQLITTKGVGMVSFGAIISTVAVALFCYNGYDSAINFSEETAGSANNVGRAVMYGAVLSVFFELIAVLAILLGTKSLPAFFSSSLPVYAFLQSYLGTVCTKIMVIGVVIAVFDATLAIVLQFSRVLYSTARDESWPGPVNRLLNKVHPTQHTPWGAALVCGLAGTILTFFSSVVSAITFTAVFIVMLYGLIAICAIVQRFIQKDNPSPYRDKLWPVSAIIALVGVAMALYYQSAKDVITCCIIFAVGFLFYFWARRNKNGYWGKNTTAASGR